MANDAIPSPWDEYWVRQRMGLPSLVYPASAPFVPASPSISVPRDPAQENARKVEAIRQNLLSSALPSLNYPSGPPASLTTPETTTLPRIVVHGEPSPNKLASKTNPMKGFNPLITQNPYNHDPFALPPADPNDKPAPARKRTLDPKNVGDWSFWDRLIYATKSGKYKPDGKGGYVPSEKITIGGEEPEYPTEPPPGLRGSAVAAENPNTIPYSLTPVPILPEEAYAQPTQEAPAQEVTASTQQQPTLADTLAMLKDSGLIPDPNFNNPAQEKADAYAAQEAKRTALLAQLAFASGLTAAGGPGWEDIGKGFAAAAGTYGKGFDRYQKALQSSADRYQEQRNALYAAQLKRAEVAADLYTGSQKQILEQWKIAHQLEKDRADLLTDRSKVLFPKPSDSAITAMDPEAEKKRAAEVQRYYNNGRYDLYTDLSE